MTAGRLALLEEFFGPVMRVREEGEARLATPVSRVGVSCAQMCDTTSKRQHVPRAGIVCSMKGARSPRSQCARRLAVGMAGACSIAVTKARDVLVGLGLGS